MTDKPQTLTLSKDQRDRVNEALRSVQTVGDLDAFLERIAGSGLAHVGRAKIKVIEITDVHLAALKRLPEIYGKVVPKSDRVLTKPELAALVEERDVIDTVLKLLEARKSDSLRETLANHLDHVYMKAHPGETPATDARGHVAVKDAPENTVVVDSIAKKVQRSVSGGKRVLSYNEVLSMYENGEISEEVYNRITKPAPPPPTPRVLDEEGLVSAMKGDPGLAYTLAQASRVTGVTTSITVRDA